MATGRLGGILARLFGGGRKDKADAKTGDGGEAYRPQREVEQNEVLREDQGLFGKVYVLSLNEFYEAIGGRSGRLAESLLTICDTVFQDRLGPNDGYSPIGDDQFVFRFGGLDERQSLMQAAKIIEEIGTKLLGEHFIKSGRFKALLTAIGLADVLGEDGDVDAGKVNHAVELARQLPPEPAAPEDPVWVRLNYAGLANGDKWLAVPSRKRDSVQWVSLDYKPAKKEIQWQPLEVKKKGDDGLQWQQLERDKKKDEGLQWQPLDRDKKKDEVQWQSIDRKKKDDQPNWQVQRVARPT